MDQGRHEPAPSLVALVPARSGSKRIPDKNVRQLGGHPLLAYTLAAAHASGIFDAVVVSTDSADYAQIAEFYGAEIPELRPTSLAQDRSPDIEWVRHVLDALKGQARDYDCMAILRPTSPFRQARTIRRAWDEFLHDRSADSLRAVEKCSQHPGKMWMRQADRLLPLLPHATDGTPWHSQPYASLPEILVQNASLEIAWTRVVYDTGTIAGTAIRPFLTEGYEGLDLNEELDWELAQVLLRKGEARLPPVEPNRWSSTRDAEGPRSARETVLPTGGRR